MEENLEYPKEEENDAFDVPLSYLFLLLLRSAIARYIYTGLARAWRSARRYSVRRIFYFLLQSFLSHYPPYPSSPK